MPPEAARLLDDLVSGDVARVMATMRALHETNDRAFLGALAPKVDQIEAATAGLDLGGGILPNRIHLALALSKLRAVAAGTCLCQVIAGSSFTRPQLEASRGLVEVLSEVLDRANMSAEMDVKCLVCGARYNVTERIGWHIPTYEWRQA